MARWIKNNPKPEPVKLEDEARWIVRITAIIIIAALGLGAGWLAGSGLSSLILPLRQEPELQTKQYEPPVPNGQDESTPPPQAEPEAKARPAEPEPGQEIFDEVEKGIQRGVRTGKSLKKFLKKLKRAREKRQDNQ